IVLANKVPLVVLGLVGMSDLILAAIVSLAGQAYQAFEMLGGMARVAVVLAAVRAVGALLLFSLVLHPGTRSWAVLYLATTAIAAGYAFFRVCRDLGKPRLFLPSLRGDLLEGFYFSVSLSSQSIYNNIDKTMMVRLTSLEAAGIYATAYRVLDV